ncbi:MAG: CoA transferase [Microbacterium sp.]
MEYSGPSAERLAELLDAVGLDGSKWGSSLRVDGEAPVLESPHRTGLAAALTLMAQGAATAALWEQRGGAPQDVRLEARDAVYALNPFPWLRRNGHLALDVTGLKTACTGYYPTRDGRIFFNTAVYPKLIDGTLRVLRCIDDPESVAVAIAARDGEELDQAFVEAGLTGTLVRTREEWEALPQGRLLASRPVVEIERIGDAEPIPLGPASRPLDDIRVADLTHVFAGPNITRALAEQGADVLHLGPISPRLTDPIGQTIHTGLGKRSAIVDFTDGGEAVLASLLRDADVFVQSWRPGSVDRRGFSPESVAELRPGIVYVSVSCYGLDGPWGMRGGFDPVALAATGVAEDEGRRDRYKNAPPGILTDTLIGFLGAAAVTATLGRRANEGGSWHIKLSLARIAMWLQSLGLYPEGTEPTDLGSPFLWRMDSPFGVLDYLPPALRYSVTAAHYERPPVPVGSSRAEWQDRTPTR